MQNRDYCKDVESTLKPKNSISSNYIYSKNQSIVATLSPFNSEHVIIMGLKPPIMKIILAVVTPDDSYPFYSKHPFAVFFPPNETAKKTLITFDGIRRAFGLTIHDLYKKLVPQRMGVN